jgi:hypothetical protein
VETEELGPAKNEHVHPVEAIRREPFLQPTSCAFAARI